MKNDDCCMVGSVNNNGVYIIDKRKKDVKPKELNWLTISEAIELVKEFKEGKNMGRGKYD